MIPVIKSAGVTSKAGFQQLIPSAAILIPFIYVSSFCGLSSILIPLPSAIEKSIVVNGAAI